MKNHTTFIWALILKFYKNIFPAAAGSVATMDTACDELHIAAPDNNTEQQNNHLTLEKCMTIDQSQPEISDELSTLSFTSSKDQQKILIYEDTGSLKQDEDNCDNLKEITSDQKLSNLGSENTHPPLTREEGAIAGSRDNSDSGSIISLSSSFNDVSSVKNAKTENDNESVKSKKRRSFFNFRRSKKDHKKEVILWHQNKTKFHKESGIWADKPKSFSGIIKNNILPTRLYLPWLTPIVEEECAKCVSCENHINSSSANVYSPNIPIEILASSLWYIAIAVKFQPYMSLKNSK